VSWSCFHLADVRSVAELAALGVDLADLTETRLVRLAAAA
jgi:hypothetical protein